jgi:hypothetical protein
VSLPLRLTYGVFHLRESLLPGLGAPLLIAGIVGLAAPLVAAKERRMPLALVAIFAVLWYAVHEISPLKPYPDFSRYMVPLVPFLAILAASFLYEILARWDRLGVIAAAAVILAAIPALVVSMRVNAPDVDPRAVVADIVAATGARVALDRYTTYKVLGRLGGGARKDAEGAELIVTSNLTYDRAGSYAVREAGDANSLVDYYRALGAYPYLEVSNGRPNMAYFNPVMRVIAMDGSMERLREIGKEIEEAAPGFKLEYVEGSGER